MTERRNTPLYRLKTPAKWVGQVLCDLVEGLDVSAAVRVFGHGEGTIRTWLIRGGLHAGGIHRYFFGELILEHLQLDELRTTLRRKSQELWLWVALDVQTKVVLVLQLGPRTQAIACRVVHELSGYLAPGCIPLFSSDGLDYYLYALMAHFGQWRQEVGERKRHWVAANLWYGQVKKVYHLRRLVRVAYRMRLGSLTELTTKLRDLGLGRVLNTAFVERVNLTIRQGGGGLDPADPVNGSGAGRAGPPPGMVAGLLSFCAGSPEFAGRVSPEISFQDASNGGADNQTSLDGGGVLEVTATASGGLALSRGQKGDLPPERKRPNSGIG